jgi:hypothetical protein
MYNFPRIQLEQAVEHFPNCNLQNYYCVVKIKPTHMEKLEWAQGAKVSLAREQSHIN